jgi:hypothetical protein
MQQVLDKLIVTQLFKKFTASMEVGISLSFSQDPPMIATPEPDESNPHPPKICS